MLKKVLATGLVLLFGLSFVQEIYSADYRKSHTINGSPVGLLTDYPIRVVVHYGDGIDSGENVFLGSKSRIDFGDVRFTRSDRSTQLDYWIEKKTDGDQADFWVEVASVPASPGSSTIYIYYGDSMVTTTSNGKNTFDWFDDFGIDSSIDYDIGRHATIWHGTGAYNPYYDAVNRRVAFDTDDNFSGGWMVRSFNLTIQNFAAKVTFGVTGSYPVNTTNGILGRWTGNAAYYGFYVAGSNYTAPALVRDARTTIIGSPPGNTYHPFGGIPHTMELRVYGNNLIGVYNEGEADEVILTATDATHSGAGQVEVIVGQATGWFDNFFVRKYVIPEPGHGAWGPEEGVPAYLTVTGNSSMTAGTENELVIRAYDNNDNIATSYSGPINLIFSGPSSTPGGRMPTVEGINVGTPTTVNFTNGLSDIDAATLIAYMAETVEVDVTDGTINSFGDPSYDLDLTVNTANPVPVITSDSGKCFIATAAYGSPFQSYVKILREFRNRYLLESSLGKSFIKFYYKISPPIANFIANHDSLKAMVRLVLLPFVGASWLALKIGLVPTMMLIVIITFGFIGLFRVRQKLRKRLIIGSE